MPERAFGLQARGVPERRGGRPAGRALDRGPDAAPGRGGLPIGRPGGRARGGAASRLRRCRSSAWHPVPPLRGTLRVPPDKSLTHRALLLAAVGRPRGQDRAAARLRRHRRDARRWSRPPGARRGPPRRRRDASRGAGCAACARRRRSTAATPGTLMRLLPGDPRGPGAPSTSCWTATTRCGGGPMTRVARPLRAMGATVFTAPGGTPPMVVSGGAPLRGAEHRLQVASAQVKSCLLLAGLYADGETWVHEPAPSRDHTERMLEAAGVRAAARGRRRRACAGRSSASRCPTWRCPATSPRPRPASWRARCSATRRCACEGVNLNPRPHRADRGDAADGRRRARGAPARRRRRALRRPGRRRAPERAAGHRGRARGGARR